ncbi:MAG: hypothetical protein R2862_12680 [Thermoanaerobaculia bacterium]
MPAAVSTFRIEKIELALAGTQCVIPLHRGLDTRPTVGRPRSPGATIDRIEEIATGGRRPDLALLFDLPADRARARGLSKSRRRADSVDRPRCRVAGLLRTFACTRLAAAELRPVPHPRLVGIGRGDRTALRATLEDLLAAARGGAPARRRAPPSSPHAWRRAGALAAAGRLYPAILREDRPANAKRRRSARSPAALASGAAEERPCGVCRHCVRIVAGGGSGDEEAFHPDFAWLLRDLKTSTSAEATREFLRAAQLTPSRRADRCSSSPRPTRSPPKRRTPAQGDRRAGPQGAAGTSSSSPRGSISRRRCAAGRSPVFLGSIGRPEAEIAVADELQARPPRRGRRDERRRILRLDIAHRLASAGDFDDPRASALDPRRGDRPRGGDAARGGGSAGRPRPPAARAGGGA